MDDAREQESHIFQKIIIAIACYSYTTIFKMKVRILDW